MTACKLSVPLRGFTLFLPPSLYPAASGSTLPPILSHARRPLAICIVHVEVKRVQTTTQYSLESINSSIPFLHVLSSMCPL